MKVHIPRWAELLRDVSRPVIQSLSHRPALADTFRDEAHHRRAIDPLLIRETLGPQQPTAPAPSDTPELRLWRGISNPNVPVDGLRPLLGSGPLLAFAPDTTIEILTEADLTAIHALWTIARLRRRADLAWACLDAALWHAAELQPDNATQSPWAIHVFVVLADTRGHPTAICDAEMRLHNCLVGREHPDERSALVLHHAARELELLTASPDATPWWNQTA